VLYVGDPDSRQLIRDTEFYGDAAPGRYGARPLKFNVLLTNYEMITNTKDHEALQYVARCAPSLVSVTCIDVGAAPSLRRSIRWYSMVVDEAHRLKNVESQLHERLRVRVPYARARHSHSD
jgi:SNF2 family DNA or RNA helicase